jgi:hypothetical protein
LGGNADGNGAPKVSVSLTGGNGGADAATAGTSAAASPSKGKKLKGGLTLVFDGDEEMDEGSDDDDGDEDKKKFGETCPEERRAGLARYKALLSKALSRRT